MLQSLDFTDVHAFIAELTSQASFAEPWNPEPFDLWAAIQSG